MNDLKQYMITIIAASLICAVTLALVPKDSKHHKMIQMICGVFLLLSALLPLRNRRQFDFSFHFDDIKLSANAIAEDGVSYSQQALCQLIKENTEAYIQDKATAMGAEIAVTVTVDTKDAPVPVAVDLEGSISPYAKSKLISIIANDIGIPEDQQKWS